MKVVLLQDVKSLGKKGDLVETSEGYARNFIIPKKLGVEATPANLNTLKLQKANAEKVAAANLAAAQELAAVVEKAKVTVKIKAGEGGRTFGSVSTKEIADAFKEVTGIELDKKKLILTEPIKKFGVFDVTAKLHKDVSAILKVSVEEL